ncbi:MAG TPA: hypothetical protein VE664_07545 [Actinomycetes bacterium]|nr:hypothetical protein [Actinomycetes bacterium]
MRDAVTSYLPLPARRRAPTPVWTWFTRAALWVGIGMLVAVFAIAVDPTRVAVVAILTAVAAPAWRELSWTFRTVIVLGLAWLSVAQLGPAAGLGLDALLLAWWWVPARLSGGAGAPAPEPDPEAEEEEDLAGLVAPMGASRPYELPFPGQVPASLRRFAEERRLPQEEVTMLASIRFPGEPPRTAARWHHIYNAIRTSRWLDKEGV